MRTEGAAEAHAERERLEHRKRRLYQVALVLGLLVTGLSWLTREPGDEFITYLYPVFGTGLAIAVLALANRRIAVRTVEAGLISGIGVFVMARLAWHFHAAGPIEDHLLVLAGGHYWAVAALIAGGFVALDRRGAVVFGSAVWVVSAAIAVTGLSPELWRGDVPQLAVLYLARVHGFLALLLALIAAVAALREQLHRALARAEALDELATTDGVTGLANRRAAEEALERLQRDATRYRRPVSVVLVDLDHFKEINDQHGHPAGDRVLAGAARTLAEQCRDADIVARWGGEEFIVIAPATRVADAEQLAERCRHAIAAEDFDGLSTTASFGVAELVAGETVAALISRADARLYQAKRGGRDQVVGDRAL